MRGSSTPVTRSFGNSAALGPYQTYRGGARGAARPGRKTSMGAVLSHVRGAREGKSHAETERVAAALRAVAFGLHDVRIYPGHAPHEAVPAAPRILQDINAGKLTAKK